MSKIYIENDLGVPQIACDICGKCDSIMGKSLCSIKKRGCCHYFPEFTLVDIQRMVVLDGGKEALDIILSNPGTIINHFNIFSKGKFEEEAYEKYISSGIQLETGNIKDHTIFFRTCPYVKPGSGCTLPVRFRTAVCNFFICQEILERPDLKEKFEPYLEERSRYSRWLYRENTILQHILTENGSDLISDFKGSLTLLSEIGLSVYEFPLLDPVEFDSPPSFDLSA